MYDKKDFKIERFRATGKGGQNVNKVETAVRVTHLPTGLSATCQDERSQAQNQKNAFAELYRRIAVHERLERVRRLDAFRSSLNKGRVRSYNLITNLVVDHVRNVKIHKAREVLDGNLELLEA